MTKFSISTFADECTQAMTDAESRREAAQAYLQRTLERFSPEEIIEVLEAAIPAGADIGEMIVYASPELTMLYARVPGRFRSGIHNHTVFACIGQLTGREMNTVYRRDGEGLRVESTATVNVGEVISLGDIFLALGLGVFLEHELRRPRRWFKHGARAQPGSASGRD